MILAMTFAVILAAFLAAFMTVAAMKFLSLNQASNSVVSLIVTGLLWWMFWRAWVVLPYALAGEVAKAAIFYPWWLLWVFAYTVFFLVIFRVWMGHW